MAVSLSISIAQNSQSVSNNTSNVTVKVIAKWTYGSFNLDKRSGWLKIGGTKYSFSSAFNTGMTSSGSATIFTKTVNVAHNSDGTKTLACSASYSTDVSSGTVTASASKKLTTIPRASVPTVSDNDIYLGEKVTIYTNRKSTAFTHKLSYSFGGKSGLTSGLGITSLNTSTTFTPPLSLASNVPNATSGKCIITLKTYKGSTLIGTKTVSMTLRVPASCKPSVKLTVEDATENLSKYGAYVATKSRFKATLAETLSYGSAITARTITMNGQIYTTNPATSDTIISTENDTITASVKDGRGRTSDTAKETVEVLPYAPPKINKFSVSRCNADGTANDEGNCAKVTYSVSVSPLNEKNKKEFFIKWKKKTEADYPTANKKTITVGYTDSGSVVLTGIDIYNTYEIAAELTDDFGTYTSEVSLSTAETLMDFNASGSGMSIGKISEKSGYLEVGYPTEFHDVQSFVNNEIRRKSMINLSTFEMNTVPTDDTPLAWAEFDNSIIYIDNSSGANHIGDNFPTTYGTLITLNPNAEEGEVTRLTQIWQRQGYGNLYVRGGNAKGWYADPELSGKDAWRKVFDDHNSGVKARKKITLTRNTSVVPSDSSYTCYLDPVENRVYFRCSFGARKNNYPANESLTAYTIPEEYRPQKAHALCFQSGSSTPASAVVGSSGAITFKTQGAEMGNTWYVYITGWWDLD